MITVKRQNNDVYDVTKIVKDCLQYQFNKGRQFLGESMNQRFSVLHWCGNFWKSNVKLQARRVPPVDDSRTPSGTRTTL